MFECDEDLGLDEDIFEFTSNEANVTNPCESQSPSWSPLQSLSGSSSAKSRAEETVCNVSEFGSRTQTPDNGSKNDPSAQNFHKPDNLNRPCGSGLPKRKHNEISVELNVKNTNNPASRPQPSTNSNPCSSGFNASSSVSSRFADDVWEDDDISEAFTDDITFELEEARVVQRPKIPGKEIRRTPTKRLFPGPAGILPVSGIVSESSYGNDGWDQADSMEVDREIPCTQDNTHFSGSLWQRMCSDFRIGSVFLPDLYNIQWIKVKAEHHLLQMYKAPFLAAAIIHIEFHDLKMKNIIVTLKDETGEIKAALESSLYENYPEAFSVGSVIILLDFSVLLMGSSGNSCVIITPRNLITVYSLACSKDDTQSGQSQPNGNAARGGTLKIVHIQDASIPDIINSVVEPTSGHQSFDQTVNSHASSVRNDHVPRSFNRLENYSQSRNVQTATVITGVHASRNNSNENIISDTPVFNRCPTRNSFHANHVQPSSSNNEQIRLYNRNQPSFSKNIQYDVPQTSKDLDYNQLQTFTHNQQKRIRTPPLTNDHQHDYLRSANSSRNIISNRPVLKPCRTGFNSHNNNSGNHSTDNLKTFKSNYKPVNSCDETDKRQLPLHSSMQVGNLYNIVGGKHDQTITAIDANKQKPGMDDRNSNIRDFLNQFKKRPSVAKENEEQPVDEGSSRLSGNPNVSAGKEFNYNLSGSSVFSSQISVIPDSLEHSQILQEAFDGVDACSFLDDF